MVAIVTKNTTNSIIIFENKFENAGTFSIYTSPFQDYFNQVNNPNGIPQNISTVSFFDVLDNG